jgi:DNA primase
MEAFEEIKDIVETVLGEPKRSYAGSGGWYEYNCPSCADENCGTPDDKYNLALNYEHGAFCHCWRCGWSGKISRLLKYYGNRDLLSRYLTCVKDIMESRYYEIENGNLQLEDTSVLTEGLKLPEYALSLYDENPNANQALEYLHKRGVSDDIIKRFGILYVPRYPYGLSKYINGVHPELYHGMVVIPSYDQFGNLNYFTCRDYTGIPKGKGTDRKNPDIPKKEFVFNEGMINWYEPVVLVEGPFDHIVTPNSIPLLGSTLSDDCEVYKKVTELCREKVIVMLDDDAYLKALKIYRLLDKSRLNGMVRITKCPQGYDPSDVYRDFGRKGILNLINCAEKLDDYTLLMQE